MPSRYSEIHLPFSFVFPHRRSQRQWNSLWFEEESLDPANSLTCTTRRKRETKLKICLLCWRKSKYSWHSSTIHSCNRHCILRWMPWAVAPFGVPISEYESKTCMPIFFFFNPNSCYRLGLTSLAYLWGREQMDLLKEMIDSDMNCILIKVAAMGIWTILRTIVQAWRWTSILGDRWRRTTTNSADWMKSTNSMFAVRVASTRPSRWTVPFSRRELWCMDPSSLLLFLSRDDYKTVVHSNDYYIKVGLYIPLKWHLEPKEQTSRILPSLLWSLAIVPYTYSHFTLDSSVDSSRISSLQVSIRRGEAAYSLLFWSIFPLLRGWQILLFDEHLWSFRASLLLSLRRREALLCSQAVAGVFPHYWRYSNPFLSILRPFQALWRSLLPPHLRVWRGLRWPSEGLQLRVLQEQTFSVLALLCPVILSTILVEPIFESVDVVMNATIKKV